MKRTSESQIEEAVRLCECASRTENAGAAGFDFDDYVAISAYTRQHSSTSAPHSPLC